MAGGSVGSDRVNIPAGVQQLTTVEEVEAAWDDLFTLTLNMGEEGGETPKTFKFANNKRVAITAEAIFVKLRKPIKAGKDLELTDVLRIKEPTVGDIRLTDKYKGDIEKSICLLGAVCGIPNAEINNMPASDLTLLGEVIGAFL